LSYSEALYFSYAGEKSIDHGIINVSFSTGLYEESFLPERNIIETTTKWSKKPYFQGLEYIPLTIKLRFAFQDAWDDEKIREVARWLGNKEYYQPLFFDTDINRIFYCMYVGSPTLLHNGLKQGYIELEMRCDSPYSYSPIYVSEVYSSPSQIIFDNEGDTSIYPEISITKNGDGDLSIVNQTNGGQEFTFVSLVDGENLYVDCENEYIETDLSTTYRYANFNDNYLELVTGRNVLNVVGDCDIQFRYRFKRLQ
jgi:phage-related protein